MKTLPILSLSKLNEVGHSGQGTLEHQRLYEVCLRHGFFYLNEHGISERLVQQTIEASRQFFQLSLEEKHAFAQDKQVVHPKTSRGYVPLQGETLHQSVGPDPKEIFDMGIDRPLDTRPFIGPNLLPDDTIAPGFKRFHYQLQSEIMEKIVPVLLKALEIALNLPTDWFSPFFSDPVLIHRVLYYPAGCGMAGKHTDNGIFTILIQEYFPVPSLRVHSQDHWIEAECIENAFVINLGDMLQLWTNQLFVSTPHEVIHKLACSRVSIPFFVYPNIDTVIQPMGRGETFKSVDIMLKNFESIWVEKMGAGRAQELR